MAKTQTAVKTLVAALANVSKAPSKAVPMKADVADKLTRAATMAGNAASYPFMVRTIVADLRKAKVTIGNRKPDGTGCPMATLYWDTFKALAKTSAGKPFTDDNCNKWLGAFKRMVNDGAKFSLNPSQDAAREKVKAEKIAQAANPATPASDVPTIATVSNDPKAPSAPVVTPGNPAPVTMTATPGTTVTTEQLLISIANYAASARRAAGDQSKAWQGVLTLYPQIGKLIDAKATNK